MALEVEAEISKIFEFRKGLRHDHSWTLQNYRNYEKKCHPEMMWASKYSKKIVSMEIAVTGMDKKNSENLTK